MQNFKEFVPGRSSAFNAGWESYFIHREATDNPHREGSEQHNDWIGGFDAARSNSLTFKSTDGSIVTIALDKLVFHEHTNSTMQKFYFFKAMSELDNDPSNAYSIAQTTKDNFDRYRRLHPSVIVTSTSSDKLTDIGK